MFGSESAKSQHWYVVPTGTDRLGNNLYYKIINYEKNPTTNSSFYNKILSVGYFQDNQDRDDKGNITRDYDGYEDMSFISAAETINKNLISKAYTVDRHYVRNTGISVCPRSSYLPNEFKNCSSAWNKGQSNIINAINDGRVIVHFLCHGMLNKHVC